MFKKSHNNNRKRKSANDEVIDYKNSESLARFTAGRGKILGRRANGVSAKKQREITKAIKRARALGLMPFTGNRA